MPQWWIGFPHLLIIVIAYLLSRVLRNYPLGTAVLLGMQFVIAGGMIGVSGSLREAARVAFELGGLENLLIPLGMYLSLFSLIRPRPEN